MGNNSHASPPGLGPPKDPWAAFNNPAQCPPSHHKSPAVTEPFRDLDGLMESLDSNIPAFRLVGSGLESFDLHMPKADRDAFALTASGWEQKNSRVITIMGKGKPILDDANVVLMYAVEEERAGVFHLLLFDVDGTQLEDITTGELGLEPDVLGNEILATIVTLGGAVIVRRVISAIAARVASGAVNGMISRVAVGVAKAISAEAERAMLLYLRAIRARAIVRALRARGATVTVNIGGEAAAHEVQQFGTHIALNNAARVSASRRFIPNLVKEPADNIGEVFLANSVDRVVSVRLPLTFDLSKVAEGAFRVLKSGGRLNMHLYTNDPVVASRFMSALTKAGFKDVKSIADSVFMAVKP